MTPVMQVFVLSWCFDTFKLELSNYFPTYCLVGFYQIINCIWLSIRALMNEDLPPLSKYEVWCATITLANKGRHVWRHASAIAQLLWPGLDICYISVLQMGAGHQSLLTIWVSLSVKIDADFLKWPSMINV